MYRLGIIHSLTHSSLTHKTSINWLCSMVLMLMNIEIDTHIFYSTVFVLVLTRNFKGITYLRTFFIGLVFGIWFLCAMPNAVPTIKDKCGIHQMALEFLSLRFLSNRFSTWLLFYVGPSSNIYTFFGVCNRLQWSLPFLPKTRQILILQHLEVSSSCNTYLIFSFSISENKNKQNISEIEYILDSICPMDILPM